MSFRHYLLNSLANVVFPFPNVPVGCPAPPHFVVSVTFALLKSYMPPTPREWENTFRKTIKSLRSISPQPTQTFKDSLSPSPAVRASTIERTGPPTPFAQTPDTFPRLLLHWTALLLSVVGLTVHPRVQFLLHGQSFLKGYSNVLGYALVSLTFFAPAVPTISDGSWRTRFAK